MKTIAVLIMCIQLCVITGCRDNSESSSRTETASITYRVYRSGDRGAAFRIPIDYTLIGSSDEVSSDNHHLIWVTTPWELSISAEVSTLGGAGIWYDTDRGGDLGVYEARLFTWETEVSTPNGSAFARDIRGTHAVIDWTKGNPPYVSAGQSI